MASHPQKGLISGRGGDWGGLADPFFTIWPSLTPYVAVSKIRAKGGPLPRFFETAGDPPLCRALEVGGSPARFWAKY